jgi:hypothetical protein
MRIVRTILCAATIAAVHAVAPAKSVEPPAAGKRCGMPQFAISQFRAGPHDVDRGFISGVSLVDADGDGDLDAYLTGGYDVIVTTKYRPTRSMLYLNDGKGHFRRDENNALSNSDMFASGSTWADVDADGKLDVFIPTQLGQRDFFYRNLGSGKFGSESLGDATDTEGGNFSAAWADMDGDGDLDLYSGGPALELPDAGLVYRNDKGKFVRVADTPITDEASNGAAALFADLDSDGDQDFIVANSDAIRKSKVTPLAKVEHALVFRNDGNWKFTEIQQEAAFDHVPAFTAFVADIDNDGDLDLFLGWLTQDGYPAARDRLFLNDGTGRFTEDLGFVAPEHADVPTGAASADFNGDGNFDIITANYKTGIDVAVGDGHGGFRLLKDAALNGRVTTHNSIATGDIDGDGDIDAVIGNWGETHAGDFATLLRNVTPRCGAWTELTLRDPHGAPNPPGSRVTLVSRENGGGERRQMREASAQTGFRQQGADPFWFAIPSAEQFVRAEIRWPGRRIEVVGSIPINGRITVDDADREQPERGGRHDRR